MNVQMNDIAYYLSDENRLTRLPFEQLEAWIEATPGSFLLQFAKARKYVLEGQKIPERHLNIVAALSPNRKSLKQLLYQPVASSPFTKAEEKPRQTIEEPKATGTSTPPTTPKETLDPAPKKKKTIRPSKPKSAQKIADDGTMPNTRGKKSTKETKGPSKRSAPAAAQPDKNKAVATKPTKPSPVSPTKKNKKQQKNNGKKTGKVKTLKLEPASFTEWLKILQANKIPPKQKKPKTAQKPPKAKKRLTKAIGKIKSTSTEPVSETYADLLASQGHVKKAMEIYKKLILLYPEKKGIFAQKLEKLKK